MRQLVVVAVLVVACLLLSTQLARDPAPGAQSAGAPPPHATHAAPAPHAFAFADVRRLAQQRATHDYQAPPETLPAGLANLSYDQYRDIRFRPESALWHGRAMFEVQLFHRGYRNRQRVNIFEVGPTGATAIAYSPELFTFGPSIKVAPPADTRLGFAGFRVHYPLQTPAYKDELIVFLGASYFRVLGRNQHYGASARGLAIDTGAASGEEFPTFTDFWLVRPQATDRVLTIYALLDSRSVAGAYEFQIRPGAITQVEVHSELYPRRAIDKLGVAPLTSMFLYDDSTGRRFDDFRPEVHDSDGLMAETGHAEWIWRPLANPRELRVNRFIDENPRGFGLIQRQRDFARYQDAEAQYQARPSYWVQPLGNWGKGGVELVEIPSNEEIHDNIVAYWVPAHAPEAGKPLEFAYVLSAYLDSPLWPPGGRVITTRSGSPAMGDNRGHFPPEARRIVVEFAGGDLGGLEAAQPVKAAVSADNGTINEVNVQRLGNTGTWAAALIVTPKDKKQPVNLKCFLTLYGEVLTETWVYQWTP